MKYRKKPVVIEARKLDLTTMSEQLSDMHEWITGEKIHWANVVGILIESQGYPIETLEGTMIAKDGDYIIKGVNGEFYPCKPDIFEKTYEVAEKTDNDLDTDLDTDLDGWVSVKDKLPSDGARVAFVDNDGNVCAGVAEHFQLFVKAKTEPTKGLKRDFAVMFGMIEESIGDETFRGYRVPENEVTHWMPLSEALPKPPKETKRQEGLVNERMD